MVVALGLVGCGTVSTPGTRVAVSTQEARLERASAQALVAGPALVHVYPESSAGSLFVVKAPANLEGGCQLPERLGARSLVAGKRSAIAVAVGEVACVASSGGKPLRFGWKAHRPRTAGGAILAAAP
jgi:hypothetical protein